MTPNVSQGFRTVQRICRYREPPATPHGECRAICRGAAADGGTNEYIFETDKQADENTVSTDKTAELAANFMTYFYHIQIGALETQELPGHAVPDGLRLLHGQMTATAAVFRRSSARWDDC
jgi:hypothetical protein